ncbi:restriction endonuclease subunit S [Eubacterium sp. AM18-26]|nr:restriction endonuclease subunit S [Eubacterium sp. AM18-26]
MMKPKIRFNGFTDDWEQRKLGELTIYRNGTGHEEKQSESGKYELINLNSISIDGGLKPSGKFIDEETETLLKDDLVMVLSDVGHGDLLGRVAIIPENNRFVLNQRVALLRNNSSVDIKYLFSYINAHQIYFKKQGAGSSQLNISRGSVENFEVLLPHKDEQKKIGKYLSSIDNLITLHQRKCDGLKKLKKYMLQNMFPQNGEKTPKIRFQGFINAWEQRKLGDVAQITMGQSPAGSTYSDVPSDYILVQGNADLENGWVKPRVWTTQITKQAYIGDLIMSVRAPAGAMGKTSYNAVIGRGVAAIKGNEFIYQLLVKMDKEGYWKKDSTGSTFESLNSESIKNAEIKLPSNEEQTVIGTYFEQLDHLITLHQRKVEQMKNLKKYMLQNMFPAEK